VRNASTSAVSVVAAVPRDHRRASASTTAPARTPLNTAAMRNAVTLMIRIDVR
jgi:hypothetical protein